MTECEHCKTLLHEGVIDKVEEATQFTDCLGIPLCDEHKKEHDELEEET